MYCVECPDVLVVVVYRDDGDDVGLHDVLCPGGHLHPAQVLPLKIFIIAADCCPPCCHLLCCPHDVPVARLRTRQGETVVVVARTKGVCCELYKCLSLQYWQHLWWQLSPIRRHQGKAAVLDPPGGRGDNVEQES